MNDRKEKGKEGEGVRERWREGEVMMEKERKDEWKGETRIRTGETRVSTGRGTGMWTWKTLVEGEERGRKGIALNKINVTYVPTAGMLASSSHSPGPWPPVPPVPPLVGSLFGPPPPSAESPISTKKDVMLCYVMLCYVMLCYVMSCHTILRYIMVCHVMSFRSK